VIRLPLLRALAVFALVVFTGLLWLARTTTPEPLRVSGAPDDGRSSEPIVPVRPDPTPSRAEFTAAPQVGYTQASAARISQRTQSLIEGLEQLPALVFEFSARDLRPHSLDLAPIATWVRDERCTIEELQRVLDATGDTHDLVVPLILASAFGADWEAGGADLVAALCTPAVFFDYNGGFPTVVHERSLASIVALGLRGEDLELGRLALQTIDLMQGHRLAVEIVGLGLILESIRTPDPTTLGVLLATVDNLDSGLAALAWGAIARSNDPAAVDQLLHGRL